MVLLFVVLLVVVLVVVLLLVVVMMAALRQPLSKWKWTENCLRLSSVVTRR